MPDFEASYPLFLRLYGRRCVIVGAGRVAARKAADLLRRGAQVTVIADRVGPELARLLETANLECHERRYERGDLAGAFLAFAATDDRETNAEVAAEANARGIPVNVADDPGASDFLVPATVERGELCLAVSTGGASPALAQHIRKQLEQTFGPEYEPFLEILARLRSRVLSGVPDPRRRAEVFHRLVDSDVLRLCRQGALEEAYRLAQAIVEEAR